MFVQMYAGEIENLPEPLAGKVELLPGLLLESKASSTGDSYYRGYTKWRNWVTANGLGSTDIMPARAFHVALYLASIIQSANSPSPVVHAYYSIKWAHNLAGLPSPTDCQLVKNVLEGGKRRLARPVRKKEPMTIEIIRSVYGSLYEKGNAYSLRTLCAILIGYSGFLRSQELLAIKRCDIAYKNPLYVYIYRNE